MKLSELIQLLQTEMEEHGDNEVFLNYNSEIVKNRNFERPRRLYLDCYSR